MTLMQNEAARSGHTRQGQLPGASKNTGSSVERDRHIGTRGNCGRRRRARVRKRATGFSYKTIGLSTFALRRTMGSMTP